MIYLDNAATTFPKPASVSRAVYEFIKEKSANPGRSGHKLSLAAAEEVYNCRAAAAELFGAPGPENVAFTMNATQSINMALKGALVSGGHVVTSDLEHNAVMRPLTKLEKTGVTFSQACVDLESDEKTLKSFESVITENTVMIACTHASNVCGRILPIRELGAICRKRGLIFLVDASQSAGIVPINMEEYGIDFLCMPGHKGLYGPMGTGLLITSGKYPLDTIMEGGTGSNSTSFEQPDFMPDALESGTVNAPGIAGLHAGIQYVMETGISRLFAHETTLSLALYDGLCAIDRAVIYTPRPQSGYVPVVSFNMKGISSAIATEKLDGKGFALRGGLHCSPAAHTKFGTSPEGMIRVSIGAFNRMPDIDKLLLAVKNL